MSNRIVLKLSRFDLRPDIQGHSIGG